MLKVETAVVVGKWWDVDVVVVVVIYDERRRQRQRPVGYAQYRPDRVEMGGDGMGLLGGGWALRGPDSADTWSDDGDDDDDDGSKAESKILDGSGGLRFDGSR